MTIPQIPEILKIPQIPNNLQQVSSKVNRLSESVREAEQSADMKIKEGIMNAAIPDSLFNVTDPTTGEIDFEKAEEQINEKVNAFLDGIKIPEIPSLPSIPLIPKLPALVIPSPAEIAEFIEKKIEEKKRLIQEQKVKALTVDVLQEETPFTSRQQLVNKQIARLPNAITNGRL
jgi:hypothetical protein